MGIIWNEESRQFHLFNSRISYLMNIMPNGQLGQLYFGRKIRHRDDFGYLAEKGRRSQTSYVFEDDVTFSLEHEKQEFPSFGTSDYRYPAIDIKQMNGSHITNFTYVSHEITKGKPKLKDLPATYVEHEDEAWTLRIDLEDQLLQLKAELLYTIFEQEAAIARSVRLVNQGKEAVAVETAMSMCLDLPDSDYAMLQLSGAWGRERHMVYRHLKQGIQSVGSLRGNSSPNHNPFMTLKRASADEFQGEAIGISLIYSGNFLAQAEVDTFGASRILMGIHPYQFSWHLAPEKDFQTPETVIVYTDKGLNDLSHIFHRLYGRRLVRGIWRDRERPILINNWEVTKFNFKEDQILKMAAAAKEDGIELFVLDDGWFGQRNSEKAGLGDWQPNKEKLPDGVSGLSEKITAMGLQFGLWIEPEMVNKDSRLYEQHPEWILQVPGRRNSHGRFQQVLDFSREEVVETIFYDIEKVIREAQITYINAL